MRPNDYTHDDLHADPRWQLIQRIVASAAFVRSARLSDFLLHVSSVTILGNAEMLNEQEVGVAVFGRKSGYLQSDDNVVRSNASRLRHKLDEYFATEGRDEPLRVILPKGGYVPEFLPALQSPSQSRYDGATAAITAPLEVQPARRIISRPAIVALLLLAVIGAAGVWAIYGKLPSSRSATDFRAPSDIFWASLFAPGSPPLVVPADSSLVLYETLSHHEVPLAAYINGDYRVKSDDGADDLRSPKGLAQRRLTSIADLDFVAALVKESSITHGLFNLRYARDLQMRDLNGASVILLGARESNPWVTLFDDERNFSLTSDQVTRVSTILNAHPAAGEFTSIQSSPGDPKHRAYALLAYIPNRGDDKNVLILEGTTIAGTEAATDFVLDPDALNALLAGHMRPNGTVPHFEVVLEANDFSGTTPRGRVVATRFR